MSVDIVKAIKERASTRAFLDTPVEQKLIYQILDAARFAPSGVNSQPWHVGVLQGETKKAITQDLTTASQAGVKGHPDYHYYVDQWVEPYKSRRFACGKALYEALKIKQDDQAARKEAWEANYHFFHAPVGLVFYLDKHLATGSWVDMGMFIQSVMLAAMEFGLATCAQASIADYPDIIRKHLHLAEDFHIVCGMSLGYPDKTSSVNQYRTARIEVDEFTTWYK